MVSGEWWTVRLELAIVLGHFRFLKNDIGSSIEIYT